MKTRAWDEGIFKELTGRKVDKLWTLYKEHLEGKREEDVSGRMGQIRLN